MNVPPDLKYTRNHEWIRLSGDVADVGITDYAQQQLGDVVFVELPQAGSIFGAGDEFGSIESVKAVSELFAPVSGAVIEANAALAQYPETVNTRPYEAWMVKVTLSKPSEAASLLDSAQYEALIAGPPQ